MDYSALNHLPWWAVFFIIIPLAVWSAIWKAIALYRAGGDRSVGWFVALFLFNTVGILEIVYIFAVSKPKRARESSQ
jgi:methionyl-tRNA synthetase